MCHVPSSFQSPHPHSVLRGFEWSSHPFVYFRPSSAHRGKMRHSLPRLACPVHVSGIISFRFWGHFLPPDPEHLCQPWGCLGPPATLPASFQSPSCTLVLIMWLQGSFLREEYRTPGPNSLCHAGRNWSPDGKSHMPQVPQPGAAAGPQTRISASCCLSGLPKCGA